MPIFSKPSAKRDFECVEMIVDYSYSAIKRAGIIGGEPYIME